jgi:hypothetical protein
VSKPDLVRFDVDPSTPEPYFSYIRDRNGIVARHLGGLLRIADVEEGSFCEPSSGHVYHVPSRTLTQAEAEVRHITDPSDLYGGVIGENSLPTSKTALHQVVGESPAGYSRQVANALAESGVTLPGFAVFNRADATTAYQNLSQNGQQVRLKEPFQSDHEGQAVVISEMALQNYMAGITDAALHEQGIVLEANVLDPQTISAGSIILNGRTYSFYGSQKSVIHKGRERFGGGEILVIEGDLLDLNKTLIDDTPENDHTRTAIIQAHQAHSIFSYYDPTLSRYSFDVVQGMDAQGNFISGVCDQTFRVGGLTPAEMLAIEAFGHHRGKFERVFDRIFSMESLTKSVIADVDLNYNPRAEDILPKGTKVFVDSADLRITARVEQVHTYEPPVPATGQYPSFWG